MRFTLFTVVAVTVALCATQCLVAEDRSFTENFQEEFLKLQAFAAPPAASNKSKESKWKRLSPPLHWHTTLLAGYTEAVEKRLPLVVVFHADWCLHCNRLKNGVLSRQEMREFANHAVFVLQDPQVDDAQKNVSILMSKFNIDRFPDTVIFDVNSKPMKALGRMTGYQEPKVLLPHFHRILRTHPATKLPIDFNFNPEANQVDPEDGNVTGGNLEQLAKRASVQIPKSVGTPTEPCYEMELVAGQQRVAIRVSTLQGADLVWLHGTIGAQSSEPNSSRRIARLHEGTARLQSAILRLDKESGQLVISMPFANSHVSSDRFCELAQDFAELVNRCRSTYSESEKSR